MLAHAEVQPSTEDWQAYLELLAPRVTDPTLRILVITDEAGPTVTQRDAMNQMLARANVTSAKTAVVSGGKVTRGIVTVLSWFNSAIRAFQPSDLERALTYLDVEPEAHAELNQAIVELRLLVAGLSPAARDAALRKGLDAKTAVTAPLAALRAKLERELA